MNMDNWKYTNEKFSKCKYIKKFYLWSIYKIKSHKKTCYCDKIEWNQLIKAKKVYIYTKNSRWYSYVFNTLDSSEIPLNLFFINFDKITIHTLHKKTSTKG